MTIDAFYDYRLFCKNNAQVFRKAFSLNRQPKQSAQYFGASIYKYCTGIFKILSFNFLANPFGFFNTVVHRVQIGRGFKYKMFYFQ